MIKMILFIGINTHIGTKILKKIIELEMDLAEC